MEGNKQINKNLISSLMLGSILSFPLTGLIYGFFNCINSAKGLLGIFDRIGIGLYSAILTTMTLGAPWIDEAETEKINLRLYILIVATTNTVLIFFIMKRAQKSRLKSLQKKNSRL